MSIILSRDPKGIKTGTGLGHLDKEDGKFKISSSYAKPGMPGAPCRPLVLYNNDHISVRCCCNLLTRKYISAIDNKLSYKNLSQILDDWETDLLLNELQLE